MTFSKLEITNFVDSFARNWHVLFEASIACACHISAPSSTINRCRIPQCLLTCYCARAWRQVPDARVLIVGTHADHSALGRTSLEQIWQQVRAMLTEARRHHRRYFSEHVDRLHDCLLCQSDPPSCRRPSTVSVLRHSEAASCEIAAQRRHSDVNGGVAHHSGACGRNRGAAGLHEAVIQHATTSNGAVAHHSDDNDDDDDDDVTPSTEHVADARRTLMFPHVVGYHEVSCGARGHGIAELRDAVTQQATRLIGGNADIPRRWWNVERSLTGRAERSGSVCSVDDVRAIASAQGVNDTHELVNMIHFFRAQGRLLYFPQVSAQTSSPSPRACPRKVDDVSRL